MFEKMRKCNSTETNHMNKQFLLEEHPEQECEKAWVSVLGNCMCSTFTGLPIFADF